MKLCILGDTHFGMRGDSLEFHKHYEKFYNDVFFPYLIDNKIDTVFQLGDLFDRRKFINFNSLYLARKYFFNKLKENNIKFYTLLGNHDVTYKNTLEVNSSQLLLNEYDNITIFEKFETINFDGIPFNDMNGVSYHSTLYAPAQFLGGVQVDRSPGLASTFGPANYGGTINLLSRGMNIVCNII